MIGAHALTIKADITYRQLDYWTRAGLLQPMPRDAWEGTGHPREYPDSEIPVARAMGRLTKAGLTPRAAVVVARQLVREGRAELGGFMVSEAAS